MTERLDLASGWSWGSGAGARTSRRQAFGSRAQSDQTAFDAAPIVSNFLEAIRQRSASSSKLSLSDLELGEIQSLAQEKNSGIFWEGFLNFGMRLQHAGKVELASQIYGSIAELSSGGVKARATDQLDSMLGKGSFGRRVEFLGSSFVAQSTSPRAILPMLAGTLVGEFVGTAALSRLMGGARISSPWLHSAIGQRVTAKTFGFLAEVSTFAAANRALSPIPGRALSQDLASAALTVGAFRLFGWAGREAELRARTLGWNFPRGVLGTSSAFFALASSHKIEERLGLRPVSTGENFFLETAHSLLALSVGSYLGHRALGERFARYKGELGAQARLSERPARTGALDFLATLPVPAYGLNVSLGNSFAPRNPLVSQMLMTASGNGKGGKNNGDRVSEETTLISPPPQMSGEVRGKSSEQAAAPEAPPSMEVAESYMTIDGRYEIDSVLGVGGMGIVYLATHKIIGKKVALKVMRSEISSNQDAMDRFLNEARTASAIGNKHIVDISDAGHIPDGSAYFVMEYLKGTSLGETLENGQAIAVSRAIPIARQLADGLAAAHRAGIIHRDLKPDNIFLAEQGAEKDFVKILDFGIAKMKNYTGKKLTKAGIVFGTPGYMPPEQAQGLTIDQRTDIYAYGVVLYEMLSGRVPFFSEDVAELVAMQLTRAPIPINMLEGRPQDVPAGLEAIVMKSLAKRPEDRFQSMEEVIAALDQLSPPVQPVSAESNYSPRGVELPSENTALVLWRPEAEPRVDPVESKKTTPWNTETGEFPRRRWPLYGGIAAAGATALIAVLLANRKSDPSDQAVVPGDAASPDAGAKVTVTPLEPDARPAPVLKPVKLTVFPNDAHIFKGNQDLGAKQVNIEVEEGSVVEIEIRREGFKTQKLQLDGSKAAVSVRLERKKGPRPQPQPPNNPDNSFDLVDPLKNKKKKPKENEAKEPKGGK